MKDEIFIKGKKYITTKSASELTGYTSDYVGQISRSNKIKSMMIGHTRYVCEDDVLNYGEGGGILIDGKKYISTKKASELTGYTSDYIGQISRSGTIKSKLVGKTKFVEEIEILEYTKKSGRSDFLKNNLDEEENVESSVKKIIDDGKEKKFTKTESANYFGENFPLIPELKKDKKDLFIQKKKIISPFETPHSFISDTIFKKVVALCLAVAVILGPYAFMQTPYAEASQEKLKSLANNIYEIGNEIIEKINKDGVIILLTDSVGYTKNVLTDKAKLLAVNTANVILSADVQKTSFSFKDLAKTIYLSINSLFEKNRTEQTQLVKAENEQTQPQIETQTQTQTPIQIQPTKTIVIEGPTKIVERILEKTSIVGGISKEELKNEIQQLDNKLSAKIYSVSSGTPNSVQTVYNVASQTNRIDKLRNVDIETPAITGGTLKDTIITGSTFNGTTISGSSLDLTGNAVIGGRLTVSGTATSTLAGDINFDSNTLYIDSINNRIGIGTSTPQYALDIVGTLNVSSIVTSAGETIGGNFDVTGNSTLGNATTSDIIYFNSRIGTSLMPTVDNVLDFGDSTNWLRWRNGLFGTSVGIGGTSTSTGSSLLSSGVYTIDSTNGILFNTTNNASTTFGTGLVTLPNLSGTNATITNATTTSFFASVFNAITSVFSSLTSGTATIGSLTATSSATLSYTGANMLITTDSTGKLVSSSTPQVASLTATSTTATSTFAGGLTAGTNSAFVVESGATANSLYVKTNGNVGIGTTSPYAKLSVVGEVVAPYYTSTSTTLESSFPRFTSSNATITNATTTSFYTSVFNAVSGIFSDLIATTFIATNSTTTNATSTMLAITNTATTSSLIVSNNTTLSSLIPSRLLSVNGSGVVSNTNLFSWISGTSNQITVTDDADGTITLSIPQDIHTGANPTFNNLTLTGTLNTTGLVSFTQASTTRLSVFDTLYVGGTATTTITQNSINIPTGGNYQINGTSVLSATVLGSGVLSSSLTSTGALNAGSITSGFGSIDVGDDNITTTGLGTLGNLLLTGSSTLQNFTFVSATGTNATTTNFFASVFNAITSVFSSLTSGTATIGSLTATSSATLSYTGTDMLITTDSTGKLVSSSTPQVASLTATSTTATSTFAGGLTAGTNSAFVVEGGASANSLYVKTNGNVGIGTTSPYAKLSVTGEVVAPYYTSTSTTLESSFPRFTSSNATITNATTTSFYTSIFNAVSGIFSDLIATTFIATNSTTTNATSTMLAITNTATTSSLIVSNNTTLSSLIPSRLLSVNGSGVVSNTNLFSWISGTSNQITITDDADGTVTLSIPQDIHTGANPTFNNLILTGTLNTTGLVSFTQASTTRLSVFDTLYVGGTATTTITQNVINIPTGGNYQINGASVLSATVLGSGVLSSSLTSVGALNAGSITSGFGSIDVGDDSITTTGTVSGGTVTSTNASATSTFAGGLAIETSGLVYDYSTNNVGIGTASPSYKLDVNGIVNATSLYVNGSPYIGSQWTTLDSNIYYNTGNVGIGTTTPYAKLSVEGTSALGNSALAGYFIATSTTATSTFAGFIDVNGTGANATSTIASNLWVKGTLRTGTGSLYMNDTALNASNGGFQINSTATSTFSTNGLTIGTNQLIVQQTSGNVGIGMAAPTAILNIKAGSDVANGAPLKLTSGALTTGANITAGSIEFLTDAFYGTITTGAARKTFAFLESPSFTTPTLGVASGTSLALGGATIGTNALAVTGAVNITGSLDASVYTGLTMDYRTKSLLHFGGADASTTFTDETGKVWTASGNAQIDDAQSKFSGTSFLSSTGYIDTPDSEDFNVGTGDFTVEAWVRRNSANSRDVIYIQGTSTTATQSVGLQIDITTNTVTGFIINATTGTSIGATSTGTITADSTWHHIAFIRDGNTLRLFIDGVADGTGDVTGITVNNSTQNPQIGAAAGGANPFDGWIDEFRFSKGIARWTTNFTLPTSPYRDVNNNLLAYNWNRTGNDIFYTTGNVGIGTTTPYAKLSVEGTSALGNSALAGYFIATSTTATSTFAGGLAVETSGLVYDYSTNNVGIGTESPAQKLVVAGNIQLGAVNDNYFMSNSGYGMGYQNSDNVLFNFANGSIWNYLDVNNNTSDSFRIYGNVATSTNTSALFTVLDTGNVGIGTTTPGSILSLGDTGANTINISATATSTFGSGINLRTGCFSVNGVCVGGGSSSQWTTTGSNISYSTGNIGIGTTTPNNKLSIYDTSKSAIEFSGASGDTYKWTMGMDVANGGRFSIASSTALGTTDRLIILGNGNIGIATTTATEALTLQGNFKINDFTFKSLSTTEMSLYDSTNNQIITFDQGTTASVDPIWGQSTRDEFLLGTFFRTFLSSTDTVILDEKSAGVLYSDGSFTSVVNEFEFSENFQKFTVETKIPTGTSMTAIIESSDDNFATVKSSLDIPLKDGLNNYDAWALKDAKFFRATFNFNTTDTSISPELISFETQGIISEEMIVTQPSSSLTVNTPATEPTLSTSPTPEITTVSANTQVGAPIFNLISTDAISLSANISTSSTIIEQTNVTAEDFLTQLKNIASIISDAISGLPKLVVNAILEVKQLIADKIMVNTAQVGQLEVIDKITGEAYCTWIANGEWIKEKGKCTELVNSIITTSSFSSGANLTQPVITLIGNNPAEIIKGTSFVDPGATAVDSKGQSLMPDITENNVDTSLVGEYKVVWSAHDSALNYASTTRKVIVVNPYDSATTTPVVIPDTTTPTSATTTDTTSTSTTTPVIQ